MRQEPVTHSYFTYPTLLHTTYKHSTLSIIASEAQLAFGLYNCVFNVSHTCVELSALYNIGPIQIAHMDA